MNKGGDILRKFRVLTVCGTGIATATVLEQKLEELMKERGLQIEAVTCKAAEVQSKLSVFMPDVVVTSTIVDESALHGVKKFVGLAFLTGIGMEELADQIADYLRSLDKEK
jgi:PTS system galactitol-specific IIB component